MSVERLFEQYFKPEARKKGLEFIKNKSVILSNKSDTHIQGYIKGAGSSRVTLTSSSIESSFFNADCTCTSSKKGQLCKHIWAVILATENIYPDFLTSKDSIEKVTKTNPKLDAIKEKQSDYRKLQYQKQKLRMKKFKLEKEAQKINENSPRLPTDVENAYNYFEQNGFTLERPLNSESLNSARKKLARLFHPDLGGTHDETVHLNHFYEILIKFLSER